MADLTDFWQGDWKRDWLKLYEWQRGRTIKQVIRECLTGNCSDIVEQEVKRRMSGAETATILNVDFNAASASKAMGVDALDRYRWRMDKMIQWGHAKAKKKSRKSSRASSSSSDISAHRHHDNQKRGRSEDGNSKRRGDATAKKKSRKSSCSSSSSSASSLSLSPSTRLRGRDLRARLERMGAESFEFDERAEPGWDC